MNLSLVLRNLSRRRSRTLIGVLGILLTLALLTTIQVALDSISVSYLDLVALQAGRADILISRQDADPLSPRPFDPQEVVAALADVPEVRGVSPRLLGLVQLQHTGREFDAVLIGLDPAKERDLDIAGVRPAPGTNAGSCALSKSLADKLKVKPGTRIWVRSPENYSEKQLSFDAALERQQLLPQQIRDYVVVNLPDARELLGLTTDVQLLAGALREPQAFYSARDLHGSVIRLKSAGAKIAARLGMDYQVRLPKAAALTAFQDFTSPLRAVFGVFALLALVITGLLIYSLLSVSVEERIREYAILRTLGARRREVWFWVVAESMAICLMGVAPGVLAGALFAKGLVALIALAMGGSAGAVALEVRPATLLLTFGIGALLAIVSALLPALQATRWRIVDALDPLRRGQIREAPTETSGTRPLIAVGVALSALSGVVFFVLPGALFSGNPSLIGTIFLCLLLSMLLGLTLATLGLLGWVQQALLFLIGGLFGPAAELVGRNLRRHRRRHRTTALLFCLSVSLVIFIASLVALSSRTAMSLVEQSHGADVRVHSPRLEDESMKPALGGVQGVAKVSEARFLHSRSELGTAYDVVLSDLVGMKNLWMVPYGVDEFLPQVLYQDQMAFAEGDVTGLWQVCTNPPATMTAATRDTNPPVVLSLAVARFLEVGIGDTVHMSFHLGSERAESRFRVAAVCRTLPGFENFRGRVAQAVGSGVLIPMREFRRLTSAAPQEAFQALYFVRTAGSADAQKATAQRIRDDFGLRHRFAVKCTAEQKQEALAIYWGTQVFFGFLLSVAVTIAVFALVASMATTVMERTREIGVLKALGMRRQDLFRLFFGEATTLTLSAGIAGGAIGFILAWFFVLQAAVLMEIAVTFTMPYLTLIATLVTSILAGLLAAYLPTRSLLRKTAAEILRW